MATNCKNNEKNTKNNQAGGKIYGKDGERGREVSLGGENRWKLRMSMD